MNFFVTTEMFEITDPMKNKLFPCLLGGDFSHIDHVLLVFLTVISLKKGMDTYFLEQRKRIKNSKKSILRTKCKIL